MTVAGDPEVLQEVPCGRCVRMERDQGWAVSWREEHRGEGQRKLSGRIYIPKCFVTQRVQGRGQGGRLRTQR